MNITNIKLKTLLSFIQVKYGHNVIFTQSNTGYGCISIMYDEDNSYTPISWVNETERDTKIIEYIFLNGVA